MNDRDLEGFYWRHPEEKENVRLFVSFVQRNKKEVDFFRPNPALAPWHWQAVVGGTVINFWPHKLKVQVDGKKAQQGIRAMQKALDDEMLLGDFHVID